MLLKRFKAISFIMHVYVLSLLLFKEIQLEIGFIEERRTTWGSQEVPQTLFYYSSYPQKLI